MLLMSTEGFTIKQWKTVDGFRKRRQRMKPVMAFMQRWIAWRPRDWLITKKINLIAKDLLKSIVAPKETFLPGDDVIVQEATSLIATLEQITVCLHDNAWPMARACVRAAHSIDRCRCCCMRTNAIGHDLA